ncbi:MAG: hypothetical protein U0271_32195 [Polyangiaceae bacterium]
MTHALGLPVRWSLVFALTLATPLIGCGDDTTGGGGAGAGPSTGGSTNGGSGGTGATGTGGEGGGGVAGCEGPEATIDGITLGNFGVGSKVSVNGVVAMSHKFLVSKSSTTNNCLWGVFVSSPGLAETGPNTGLLVLSYGFKAEIPQGGTTAYCPRLGQDPAGDKIPDNIKPGDKLDVVGTVSRFPDPPECTAPNPPNQVGMLQLGSVCKATIVGTETPPAPRVLTPDEIAKISSTTDAAFHDEYGAVKVRIENVGVTPQNGMVTDMYGNIVLDDGVTVGDKIYYRGYSNNICHASPEFTDTSVMFDHVDGFHYLNFCTWGIQPNDKCADFSPRSGDCTADVCQPDFLN